MIVYKIKFLHWFLCTRETKKWLRIFWTEFDSWEHDFWMYFFCLMSISIYRETHIIWWREAILKRYHTILIWNNTIMHSCSQKVVRLSHETHYFNPTIASFQVYFGKSPTKTLSKTKISVPSKTVFNYITILIYTILLPIFYFQDLCIKTNNVPHYESLTEPFIQT
jgi:hypothetical protein